jgi:phage terminase Nu1 subunit (DNA packaging protein)
MSKKVRWSLSQAASEFSISINTLRKRLEATGQEPANGTWSTKQILSVLDSQNPERDREAAGRARNWELRVRKLGSQYLDRADVECGLEKVVAEIVRLIEASEAAPAVKKDCKNELSRWRDAIETVAAREHRNVVKPEKIDEEVVGTHTCLPKPPRSKGPMSEYRAAREREARAKADHWQLKNSIMLGKRINTEQLNDQLSRIFLTVRELIYSGFRSREAAHPLLTLISTIPIAVSGKEQK